MMIQKQQLQRCAGGFGGFYVDFFYQMLFLQQVDIIFSMKAIQNAESSMSCQGKTKVEDDQEKNPDLELEFHNNCKREQRERNHKILQQDYKLQEKNYTSFSNQLSPLIEKMVQAEKNFQNFIGTLGPLLKKKLPDSITKHLQHKPANLKSINHLHISHFIRQRTDKMIKNKRIKKNWTMEDLLILIWVVGKYVQVRNISDVYYQIKFEDWEQISSMIPACSAEDCMFKWLTLKKVSTSWKQAEDDILIRLTQKKLNETKEIIWNELAKELFHENPHRYKVYRGGKHCRERWNCFLNPNIKKGLWDIAEDIKLIQLIIKEKGNKKWSKFVPLFGGRTENALKNRFHLILQKQFRLRGGQITDEKQILQSYLSRSLKKQKQSQMEKQELNIPEIGNMKKIETSDIQSDSQMEQEQQLSLPSSNHIQFPKNPTFNMDFYEIKEKTFENEVPDLSYDKMCQDIYDIAQYLQM